MKNLLDTQYPHNVTLGSSMRRNVGSDFQNSVPIDIVVIDDNHNEGLEYANIKISVLTNDQHDDGTPIVVSNDVYTINIGPSDMGVGIGELSKDELFLESTNIKQNVHIVNKSNLDIEEVYITDVRGVTLKYGIKDIESINIGDLPSGYYFVNILTHSTINMFKVIKI